ncbi:MAG TPA: hypothetical protein VGL66_15255 [Caulobacteraceae bacterium]|jgi:hypothetical protein
MKLLLRRSHRYGLVGSKRIYVLDVRAHVNAEELAGMTAHGLLDRELYGRLEMADRGAGLLGLAYRSMFGMANLTITVRDLIGGKRIECADLVEVLAVEDVVRRASQTISLVLAAGQRFDGEEVVNL